MIICQTYLRMVLEDIIRPNPDPIKQQTNSNSFEPQYNSATADKLFILEQELSLKPSLNKTLEKFKLSQNHIPSLPPPPIIVKNEDYSQKSSSKTPSPQQTQFMLGKLNSISGDLITTKDNLLLSTSQAIKR